MHTDKELKFWEDNTQSKYRTGRLSPRWVLLAERAGIVWRDAVAVITKEMCIAEIKRVAKQLGHTPTQVAFSTHAIMHNSTVIKLFGTWNKALSVAGMKVNHSNNKVTKTQALQELKHIAKLLGHAPITTEFDKHANMHSTTVINLFGTWNKGLKAADLVPSRIRGVTKSQVLAEVKRIDKMLGRTPTSEEFTKHASMSIPTVCTLFGTWNRGLQAASLVPARAMGITKVKALAELNRVATKVGHTPIIKEFTKHAHMSHATISKLFGTWNAGLNAAGLTPTLTYGKTKTQVIAEIKRVAKLLKHTPTIAEFIRQRASVIGLSTIDKLFGSWNGGLKAAGLVPTHVVAPNNSWTLRKR
jgi:hypothetical protein